MVINHIFHLDDILISIGICHRGWFVMVQRIGDSNGSAGKARRGLKIALLFLLLIQVACGGPGFTHLKKGSLVSMPGEIDNIIRTEFPYDDKEMISITSVGFASVQGISLIGLQPAS